MALALSDEVTAIEALEEVLVDVYRARIGSMASPESRRYLRQLNDANEELHKLAGSQPVDYEMPAIGDAYALKFHLMRADNLLVALAACNKANVLPDQAQVLDLGSGTGSTAWALAAWSATVGGSYDVASVEESREMMATHLTLWRSLQRSSRLAYASVARASEPATCDVLATNHLFSVPRDASDARNQVRDFLSYAARVRSGGIAIILTPNVEEKLELTRRTVQGLAGEGFETILDQEHAEPPKEVTSSGERRPLRLCQLRREIDQMGDSLGFGRVFRDPEFDDPYFGFYGRLTILTRI